MLVTGVTGYVGSWVAYTLLRSGFRVRGTVRSLAEQQRFVHLARDFCPKAKGARHGIKIVEADLLDGDIWDEAVHDCTYVIHCASPNPLEDPKTREEVLRPAVDGTLHILAACAKSETVKRVVLTSSAAAIALGRDPMDVVFTEEIWAQHDNPKFPLSAYEESKLRAERAAWEFIKSRTDGDARKLELCTILPTLIVGAPFAHNVSASVDLVRRVLLADMVYLPDVWLDCVSIEDVARAHVLAMLEPEAAGKRFLLHGGQISLQQLGTILNTEFRPKGYTPTKTHLPTWLLRLASCLGAQSVGDLSMLGVKRSWRPENCHSILKMSCKQDVKQMFLDLVYGTVRIGLVEDKSKHYTTKAKRLDKELVDRLPGDDMLVEDILHLRSS